MKKLKKESLIELTRSKERINIVNAISATDENLKIKRVKKENLIELTCSKKTISVINSKRVNDAKFEIEKVHETEKSFIVFAVKRPKWQQYSFKKDEIGHNSLMNLLSLNLDTYMSMNSFRTPRRILSNLYALNCLWSDLDYYKEKKYANLSAEQMIKILEKDPFIKKFKPSFYVASGGGLYPIWLLENAYAEACLAIWNKLMKVINENLKKYGADSKSTDATRVLRLAGSHNVRAKSKSFLIKESLNYEVKRYTIPEVSELLLPKFDYTKKEWEEIKIKKRKNKKEKAVCEVKSLFNIHTLNYKRMLSLQALVELRGYEPKCKEHILFLYRYWGNCFWSDKERALEETLEFNKMFLEPCSVDDVKKLTETAERAAAIWEEKINEYWSLEDKPPVKKFFKKTGAYMYSNKRLIELLEITEEEMKDPRVFIINTKEKNRRNASNRKQWQKENDTEYRKKVRRNESGLTARQQAKEDKINAIIKYKEEGLNQSEIAEKLGVSRQAISKLVKEINNNSNENNIETISELDRITDTELNLLA